jgi:hypothetical protein
LAAALWRRFRRLMAWMFLTTVTTVGGACWMLYRQEGVTSAHLYIAVALGMSLAMLLMSGLMGLVFLSHNSGHGTARVVPSDDATQPEAGPQPEAGEES